MTHENQFTPRAEEALRLAQEAAEEMGHGYVGCEHILLGLMREEDGIAHRVMQEYGMTEDMICTVLERSVGKGLSGAAPSQGLTPRRVLKICMVNSPFCSKQKPQNKTPPERCTQHSSEGGFKIKIAVPLLFVAQSR